MVMFIATFTAFALLALYVQGRNMGVRSLSLALNAV